MAAGVVFANEARHEVSRQTEESLFGGLHMLRLFPVKRAHQIAVTFDFQQIDNTICFNLFVSSAEQLLSVLAPCLLLFLIQTPHSLLSLRRKKS